MTEAEKNEIVGLVMTEISSQAVDFDINTEQPQANDLLTAVREVAGRYVGVTLKWDDVARIATELANQAATRAEQAETDANNILEQVQSKGTEITNFVATSKTEIETQKNESVEEVRTVYQGDLNELKGDLAELRDSTENVFDIHNLLKASGWKVENGIASGSIRSLATAFPKASSTDLVPIFGDSVEWVISFKTKTDGNATSAHTRGLSLTQTFNDGASAGSNAYNDNTDWVEIVVKSGSNKTGLKYIGFDAGSGLDNIWHIKDFQILLGTQTQKDYIQHFSANDINARNKIIALKAEKDEEIGNLDYRVTELESKDIPVIKTILKQYGVKIKSDGTVSRYGDAVGMNNNYVVGTNYVNNNNNDFDDVFPWCNIKTCNIYTDSSGDEKIIYESDSAFKRDGSNGDVFVEIPKFYTKRYKESDGSEIILISGTKYSGYVLEPAFVDSETGTEIERIYVGAYLSSDNGTKLDSYSGTFPMANKSFATIKSLNGEMYDFVTLQAIQKLITIEFAKIDMSPIMGGLSDMVWSSCRAYEDRENTNVGLFGGASYINNLRVGSTIGVGSTFGEIQNRTITAIEEVTTNQRRITFDGSPVDLVNNVTYLYSTGQKSGDTDSLSYHTGRIDFISGKPMANQFKYRGIEGLWGNLGEFLDGIRVNRLRAYWDNIKANYSDITKMHKLNFVLPLQNTYSNSANPLPQQVASMGWDFRYPTIAMPEVLTTYDTTRYGDSFFTIYDVDQEGRNVSLDTEYIGISSMAWDGKQYNGLYCLRFWATESSMSMLYGARKIKRSFN